MPDIELLATLASQPISESAPTGESVRYDDLFAQVEAEVNKLENPAGGDIDWRLVVDGSATILGEKAKDALVAAWLVRGCFEREGLPGLEAGLVFLREFLASFWEGMHPERLRPRRAALEWLGDRLAAILDPENGIDHDPALLEACVNVIENIVTWSEGKFEEEDCGLIGLRRTLREQLERIRLTYGGGEEAAAEASDDAGNADAGDEGVAVPGARASGPAGPIANRAAAIGRLKELGDWFTKHEPHSPIGLLIRKAERWSKMSFEDVFQQLLRKQGDAQEHVWDVLGIEEPESSDD